ncbi:MAG: hypothetical protein M5U12_15270 [Verrucomicrobia bacterium]|nr:hypothetical protein [Verrucomicrobiota bacterium]
MALPHRPADDRRRPPPLVLCSPQIRLAFKRFFEASFAELAVLSYAEIPARVEVQNTAVIPCPD